ncbi:hypothetical protein SCUP515_12762 [Seiridium cupressi]
MLGSSNPRSLRTGMQPSGIDLFSQHPSAKLCRRWALCFYLCPNCRLSARIHDDGAHGVHVEVQVLHAFPKQVAAAAAAVRCYLEHPWGESDESKAHFLGMTEEAGDREAHRWGHGDDADLTARGGAKVHQELERVDVAVGGCARDDHDALGAAAAAAEADVQNSNGLAAETRGHRASCRRFGPGCDQSGARGPDEEETDCGGRDDDDDAGAARNVLVETEGGGHPGRGAAHTGGSRSPLARAHGEAGGGGGGRR